MSGRLLGRDRQGDGWTTSLMGGPDRLRDGLKMVHAGTGIVVLIPVGPMSATIQALRTLPMLTRLPTGRPPGLTTIENDEQLRVPIREMRRSNRRTTMPAVAAFSAVFTVDEIRGYLKVTGRTWTEFLRSF